MICCKSLTRPANPWEVPHREFDCPLPRDPAPLGTDRRSFYAYHIPRQFNLICEKVMRRGAMGGVDQIDEQIFPILWRMVQSEFALELTPDIRRLLYVARRSGGLSSDIDDAALEQLGVETFVELLPMLKSLEGDLLIRQEDGRLLPSALVPDEDEHSD
jgi:hypothetical protein